MEKKTMVEEITEVINTEGFNLDSRENTLLYPLQEMVNSLQQERDKNEFRRISLILISAILMTIAIIWQTVWGVLLLALVFIFVARTGPGIHAETGRIDQNISAATSLIVELLKEGILREAKSKL